MYNNVASILLIIGIAFFLAYVIFLVYSNSLLQGQKNEFKNSFPYNFYQTIGGKSRLVLYSLLGISCLLTMVGESFFLISFCGGYMYILACIFPISLLFLCVSNILSLNFYKAHISLAFLSFFLLSLGGLLLFLTLFIPNMMLYTVNVIKPIFIIIGVLSLLLAASLVNPKLLSWFKMDKTEENGKTYYIKPKVNYCALYEWIFLMMHFIYAFLFLLNILLIG